MSALTKIKNWKQCSGAGHLSNCVLTMMLNMLANVSQCQPVSPRRLKKAFYLLGIAGLERNAKYEAANTLKVWKTCFVIHCGEIYDYMLFVWSS